MANYNVEINYLNEDNEYDTLFPSAFIPRGIIVMWSGAKDNIPNGWLLCDGTNNTPDLRNKFVLGAGSSYNVGATGGAQTVSLSISQMPSHNHSASTSTNTTTTITNNLSIVSNGSHTHNISNITSGVRSSKPYTSYPDYANYPLVPSSDSSTPIVETAGSHSHSLSGTINASSSSSSSTYVYSAGSGQAHENMPPYYALCYLMKE